MLEDVVRCLEVLAMSEGHPQLCDGVRIILKALEKMQAHQ